MKLLVGIFVFILFSFKLLAKEPHDYSGFHIGAYYVSKYDKAPSSGSAENNAGLGSTRWLAVDAGLVNSAFSETGITESSDGYGLEVGYGHQIGRWVFGLDATKDTSNISRKNSVNKPYNGGGDFTLTNQLDSESSLSLTSRVGYVTGPWLWFVRAGVERTKFNIKTDFDDSSGDVPGTASKNDEIDGFKYGLGLAYAITSKLSIQSEYSKIDYDTISTNTGNLSGYPGSIFQQKYDLDSEDFKIGLNYRF